MIELARRRVVLELRHGWVYGLDKINGNKLLKNLLADEQNRPKSPARRIIYLVILHGEIELLFKFATQPFAV